MCSPGTLVFSPKARDEDHFVDIYPPHYRQSAESRIWPNRNIWVDRAFSCKIYSKL